MKMNAQKIIEEYKNDPECYINGVFSADIAKKKAMAKYGEGAKTTRRRFVGGKGAYFQDQELNGYIDKYAKEYNVDPLLVAAMASVESNGKHIGDNGSITVSPVGALGVMQLMPYTAASEDVNVDPYDKEQNVKGGVKYLKKMLDTFGGNVENAVSAYNAGPGGNFNNAETRNYRQKVMDEYARLKKQAASSSAQSIQPYKMPTQGASIDEQVGNLKDTWKHGVMDWVGGVVKDVFHYTNPTISSAARSAAHNAEVSTSGNSSWHVHNDALDVVFDEGQNLTQEQKDALVKYFKDTGMFEEVLYHNFGSGWHLHLGGLKTSAPPQSSDGGQWIEEEVSNYNPVLWKELSEGLDREGQYSAADYKRRYSLAAEEMATIGQQGGTTTQMRERAEEVRRKYNLSEMDANGLWGIGNSNNVPEAQEAENYTKDSRARNREAWRKQDAAEKFYDWEVDNPNADSSTVLNKMGELGVPSKMIIEARKAYGVAANKELAWANDPQKKMVFNQMAEKYKFTAKEKIYAWAKINTANEQLVAAGGKPMDAMAMYDFLEQEGANLKVYPKGFSGALGHPFAWAFGDPVDSGSGLFGAGQETRGVSYPPGMIPEPGDPNRGTLPNGQKVRKVEGKGWIND